MPTLNDLNQQLPIDLVLASNNGGYYTIPKGTSCCLEHYSKKDDNHASILLYVPLEVRRYCDNKVNYSKDRVDPSPILILSRCLDRIKESVTYMRLIDNPQYTALLKYYEETKQNQV